jgi:NarL family two-component system response regulator LiaR
MALSTKKRYIEIWVAKMEFIAILVNGGCRNEASLVFQISGFGNNKMSRATNNLIRIIIVDDHPVIRYGLGQMIGAADDIEIVGELEDIDGLAEMLASSNADIVLLDLELEHSHGVEALRTLRENSPSARVIIYTAHDDEERIVQAAKLGIDGYMMKGSPPEQLIDAIYSVYDGGSAIQPSVAGKLMRHMSTSSNKEENPGAHFSKREKQVLELLSKGKTNKSIGSTLFISESTVKFHVHAILNKLDANNRTEAVSIATQLGIIDLTS